MDDWTEQPSWQNGQKPLKEPEERVLLYPRNDAQFHDMVMRYESCEVFSYDNKEWFVNFIESGAYGMEVTIREVIR